MFTSHQERKDDHLRINLTEDVQSGLTTGLERYRFIHQALPEFDLDAVDTSCTIFSKHLSVPLLISSMTGGTIEASRINFNLASAAQATGIAMGIGSQRAAIESPALSPTFQVRKVAPDILLFANLGAIQLNYGYSPEHCLRAVEMIAADALFLHLNPLQEALQPEGNTHFAGLLSKIEAVCHKLPVPVIVKEVGWGISDTCARQLISAGVAGIDVAGAGGTSWSQVEMSRIDDPDRKEVAETFKGWGIPTAEAIRMVRQIDPKILVIGSGGLKNGIDVALCLTLGADLCGIAHLLLRPAAESVDATIQKIKNIQTVLKLSMFASGNQNITSLKHAPLIDTLNSQVMVHED